MESRSFRGLLAVVARRARCAPAVLCFAGAMQTESIVDLEDPRVAPYRNLREAALAREHDRFIVEGRGNLLVLLEASAMAPDSILLSERAARGLADDLARLDPGCPVFVASQSVIDAIAGFPFHRGVLASGRRPAAEDPLRLAKQLLEGARPPRLVVLEGVLNHDNVGGIFRNAMGLGGDAILLCPQTCDPLYRKAIRTSMGGSLVVPFARAADLDAMLEGLSGLGYTLLALDPAAEEDLADVDAAALGPAAILLGTEGEGLSKATRGRADRTLRIDMEPQIDSLNVSVASAIALHRLRTR